MEFTPLGQIQATTRLVVRVRDASVVVRHEDRNDILFRVNNPDNWKLTDTGIEQTQVEFGAGSDDCTIEGIFSDGDSVIGDTRISGGIVSNCHIGGYRIDVNGDGVWLAGRKQKADPQGGALTALEQLRAANQVTVNGMEITVSGGVVYINGVRQVDDVPEPAAVGEAGAAAAVPPKPKEPDALEIIVPRGFLSGIDINHQGTGKLSFSDEWRGGDVLLVVAGRADIEALADFRLVDRFSLDYSGRGKAALKQVSCTNGMILLAERVSLEMGDFEVRSDGLEPHPFHIEQRSKDNVKIGCLTAVGALYADVFGQGSLTLGPVTAASFELGEHGSGKVTTGAITAPVFVSNRSTKGELGTGPVKADSVTINQGGSDSAGFDGITARSLVVKQAGKGRLVTGKVDLSETFTFTQTERGDMNTGAVNCREFTGTKTERGALVMNDVRASGLFKLVQSGQGRSEFGIVSSDSFEIENSERGDVDLAGARARSLEIINTERGTVVIKAGVGESATLTNTGKGRISLKGDFTKVRKENTGKGRIDVNE